MKIVSYVLLAVLCSTLFIGGCAGPQVKIGQEVVVERSPGAKEKPEWISIPQFDDKGMMYFSGGVTGQVRYALAVRQGKMEALKNLAEGVQATVRTEFSGATRGTNVSESELGDFVQDAIAVITDNLKIQGLTPKETYYEKVEKQTATGVEYVYNVYSLVGISRKDYEQARNIALNGLIDKAKKENNKKAEETAAGILDRLNKPTE